MSVTGGQATSISLDKEKHGTDWMNDGVQGGSLVSTLEFYGREHALTLTGFSNILSTSSRNMAMSLKK
jgi:hypothetical protein